MKSNRFTFSGQDKAEIASVLKSAEDDDQLDAIVVKLLATFDRETRFVGGAYLTRLAGVAASSTQGARFSRLAFARKFIARHG